MGGVTAGAQGASPPWAQDGGPAERGHPAWQPLAARGSGAGLVQLWTGRKCQMGFEHLGRKRDFIINNLLL